MLKTHIALSPRLFTYQTSTTFPWTRLSMRAKSDGNAAKKEKYPVKALSPTYQPKGVNQRRYVEALQNKNTSVVVNLGPAGTGKTLFACHAAVQSLRRGDIHKIILTRPVVSVEEEIGFLPGNLESKMDPWTRPIFDILLECYSQTEIDTMMRAGVIEISPLAFMRGRTFKRSFIIADEMQNSSPNQMLMLITRIGQGSKMVITGDLKQSDRGVNNGLADFVKRLQDRPPGVTPDNSIELVEMAITDVERSPIVKQLLEMYESPKETVVSGKKTRSRPRSKSLPLRDLPLVPVSNVSVHVSESTQVSAPDSPYVMIEGGSNTTVSASKTKREAAVDPLHDSAMIPLGQIPSGVRQRTSDYFSFAESKWEGW